MSSGTDSIHTWSLLPEMDFLARKWATELPSRFTWMKLQQRKPLTRLRESLITKPIWGWFEPPAHNALETSSASPSNVQTLILTFVKKSYLDVFEGLGLWEYLYFILVFFKFVNEIFSSLSFFNVYYCLATISWRSIRVFGFIFLLYFFFFYFFIAFLLFFFFFFFVK